MATKGTFPSYHFWSHQRQINMVFHYLVSPESGEVCVHGCLALYNDVLRKTCAAMLDSSKMTSFKDNSKSKNTGDEHGWGSLAWPSPPLNLQRKRERFMSTDATQCEPRGSAQVPSCRWRSPRAPGLSQAAPCFWDKRNAELIQNPSDPKSDQAAHTWRFSPKLRGL